MTVKWVTVVLSRTWDLKKLKKKVEKFLTDLGDIRLTGPITYNNRKVHVRWNRAADTATVTNITD